MVRHTTLRSVLPLLVLVGGAVAAFFLVPGRRAEAPAERARPAVEVPPTAAYLAACLAADLEGYEAHRDLARGLATSSVTLQKDFFAWGGNEQRTEMQAGRWWAPGEIWYDTPVVLESVGIDEEAFERLKAFLRNEELLAIQKIQLSDQAGPLIQFLPRQGMDNVDVQRTLVWHADPAPQALTARRRLSDEVVFPQHMRETALPTPGWFVRETLVERPR